MDMMNKRSVGLVNIEKDTKNRHTILVGVYNIRRTLTIHFAQDSLDCICTAFTVMFAKKGIAK